MNDLLKRLRNRLEKCLPSNNERKIVPYLQSEPPEEQPNFILRKKSKPNNINKELSFIENLIGTPQTGIASFVTSLNIECSIRQVMRTYYRCHDPSSVAHFAFTEYASHSSYGDLLALLRARLSKAEGKPKSLSLLKAFSQLNTCITEINEGIRDNIEIATPLSLGDAAAAIIDMVLEIMLTYTHLITFESGLLTNLANITQSLYQISSAVDFNEEITRVIWCQMTARLCHMLEASLTQQLKKKHLDDASINYSFKVQEVARALQPLHQIVLTLRDTYGLPIAMPPVMAFWATCDVTIQSLSDMMLRGLLKVHTARQLAGNVYRFLCATSPSPQELSALVHSPHMKMTTPVQPTLSTNLAANPFPESGRSSILSMPSPGGSQLSTHRRAMKSTASSVPIKISFVLVGFQYLVSGATGGDYSNAPGGTISHSLPRQNEWITCVGEALITSLQPNAAKQLRNLSGLFAELLFLCILVSTPKSLTGVAPNNPKHHSQKHAGIEWLFLELAENTNKFTHSWVKKTNFISRMSQMASSLGNKTTGRPPSVGHPTGRSVDLDTSQRGKRTLRSQSSSNTLESGRRSSNMSLACDVYNIGDNVDALCTVQNGTQRWFPGVVMSRTPFTVAIQSTMLLTSSLDENEPPSNAGNNQFYVYEIHFTDGEVRTQVSATEMRITKNSRSRTSSRNTSPRSARQALLSQTSSMASTTLTSSHPINHIAEGNSNNNSPQVTCSHTTLSLDGDHEKESKRNNISPVNNPEGSVTGSSFPHSQHSHPSLDVEKSTPHHHVPMLQTKSPLPSFKVDLRKSESLGSISLDDRIDMSYDDEDDEHIFTIPRVYSRPSSSQGFRQSSTATNIEEMLIHQSRSGIMVPRMQLDNLDLTTSMDHGAPGGSLSGSLLRETPVKKFLTSEISSHDMMSNNSNTESLSPRGAIDRMLIDYSRDDTSTLTRIESWRDNAGWTTRRSSGVGLPRSSRNANGATTTGASHGSTNSLFSSLHPNNNNNNSSYQSNVEALKMIHIAVADVSQEINMMTDLIKTYETIISILFYYTVTELSENQTAFPSVHRFSFASLYSKSELSSSPARTNSGASASKMESHVSQEISHDFDEFETFPHQPEKKEYGNAKQILFAIRDFLTSDLLLSSGSSSGGGGGGGGSGVSYAHIMTCLTYIGPNAIRLLKLSCLYPFENICLRDHMSNSTNDKISSGSFGTVYRVCCPESCVRAVISNINQYYAVKRITRERSLHDPAIIFDLYTEVTALETMSSFLGVCDLVNYGIHEGEYWLVLEQGICDLKEWAMQLSMKTKNTKKYISNVSTSPRPTSPGAGPGAPGSGLTPLSAMSCLSADHLLLQLYVYCECLSIVKAVHDSDIIHFDLKCNNFILRKIPVLDEMIEAANQHKLSGAIFLADFGESIVRSDCDYNSKLKQRSRGTLPIQAPEMLCLNNENSGQKYKNVRSSRFHPSALSDVWSLGCLLFEILVGSYLFENKSWTELFCMLCMEKYQQPEVVKMLTVEMIGVNSPTGTTPTTTTATATAVTGGASGRGGGVSGRASGRSLPISFSLSEESNTSSSSPPSLATISRSLGEIIMAILQQNPRDRPQITDTLGEIHQLILTILPHRSKKSEQGQTNDSSFTALTHHVVTRYPNQLMDSSPTPATPAPATPAAAAPVTTADPSDVITPPQPFLQESDLMDREFSRHSQSISQSEIPSHSATTTRSENPVPTQDDPHTRSSPSPFLTSRSTTTTTTGAAGAGVASHPPSSSHPSNTNPTKNVNNIDLVPAPMGSWIVNSQVSLNIGYIFSQCVETETAFATTTTTASGVGGGGSGSGTGMTPFDSSPYHHRTVPVYAPIRSHILDSGWRQLLPTSLDEYVTTVSSIMSQGSSFTSSHHTSGYSPSALGGGGSGYGGGGGGSSNLNKFNIERYLLRSLHNHCHSSTPALSYFSMSPATLTCDAHVLSAQILNQYAITLHSDSHLPSYVSDTSSVSIIRICALSPKFSLDSSEKIHSFLKTYRCTNGIFRHTFTSTTQHLCLIPEQKDPQDLIQIVLATLRYALDEIAQGRSVAISLDPYRPLTSLVTNENNPSPILSSSSSTAQTGSASAPPVASASSSVLLNKVYYSKICLTIAIFLACAADAAEDFSEEEQKSSTNTHLYPNLTGSTRGEKLSLILERSFFWILPLVDVPFFRELCSHVNNLHSLDQHQFHSALYQLE